jgi:outer membrane protein OmpA-like peptidoglycan-associated protein
MLVKNSFEIVSLERFLLKLMEVIKHKYRLFSTSKMARQFLGWVCWISSLGILRAQEVQWASKLIGFSSEYIKEAQGKEFRAVQVLGYPNTVPPFGQTACAWSPYNADSNVEEWVKVSFEHPQKAKNVVIVENFNPGCITQVYGYDAAGREVLLADNPPAPTGTGRALTLPVADSSLTIASIKVILNPSRVQGYNQIDAIGLTNKPFELKINVGKDAPKEILKENLGTGVNTKAQEVAPVISPDGKTLYFTRGKFEGNTGNAESQDVWVSAKQGDTWGEAQNISAPINNADHNAVTGVSSDGKTLYLMNVYRSDGTMALGFSKSLRTKSGWSQPSECKIADFNVLPIEGKTKSGEKTLEYLLEFSMSPKGNVLIIAAKLNDTNGDRDLYVSFIKPDGTWSKPQNMGIVVNTAEVESAPFIATDNKTLYFTSYGHAGYGGGDIFVTRRLDESWTKWSIPENLGPAINTPQWDGFLSIPASGDYAYVSSMQNSVGGEDIFRFKVYPAIRPEPVAIISGTVLNAIDKKPVKADIVTDLFRDSTSVNYSHIEYDPETGEYKLIVPVKEKYRLSTTKDGFYAPSEEIDLSREKNFREIKRNLTLIPIQVGTKITLSNVMFEQSKYELMPSSLFELDKMVKLMQQHPAMEILLEGHTDNQGELALNIKLSEDRVNEVKKYFVSKGIAENRIQIKAWGPTKPLASNELEGSRRRNRRVEFTILKM